MHSVCVCCVQCLESVLCKSSSPVRGLSWLVNTITSLKQAQALRGQVCHTLVQVREGVGREGEGRGGVVGGWSRGMISLCRQVLW